MTRAVAGSLRLRRPERAGRGGLPSPALKATQPEMRPHPHASGLRLHHRQERGRPDRRDDPRRPPPHGRSGGGRFRLDRRDAERSRAASGARVIVNRWPGYGPQKRFAEEQCRHPWLLNLDADEVVPADLAGEIEALFAAGEPRGAGLPHPHRRDFPGRGRAPSARLRAGAGAALSRDRGRYSPSPVHDRVDLKPARRWRAARASSITARCAPSATSSTSSTAIPISRPRPRSARRRNSHLARVLRIAGGVPEGLFRPPPRAFAAPTASSQR